MKLKNIFMCVAAMTVLFGCSDNEPILDKPVELAPTTMSICIDADGTIVSRADADATISNMYVLIFNADNTFYMYDEIPVLGDGDALENPDGTAQNEKIEVKSGAHQVLVIANADEATKTFINGLIETNTLEEVQEWTTALANEDDGTLTMSSEVMSVIFLPNVTNRIGYPASTETNIVDIYPALKGNPVDLYRSVAKIQLSELRLATTAAADQYGEPVSFELTEIFIANAKGYSRLASDNDPKKLSIEANAAPEKKALWWYGTGYKTIAEDDKLVNKEVVEQAGIDESRDLLTAITNVNLVINNNEEAVYPETPGVIGKYFYVYENEDKTTGTQTLLVLKGNYTYRKEAPIFTGDQDHGDGTYTANNRYYAIPVNAEGIKTSSSNAKNILRDHTGVIRNTFYDLRITLNGPGSDEEYNPDAYLFYNVKVIVADWNEVINIGGEVN